MPERFIARRRCDRCSGWIPWDSMVLMEVRRKEDQVVGWMHLCQLCAGWVSQHGTRRHPADEWNYWFHAP